MTKINHVLGISGGKDSAALAIYMSKNYPALNINYYTCDTGKELNETYELIDRLNSVLGKKITIYNSLDLENSPLNNPFDHFLAVYGGYLPSPNSRWCTNKLKLQPFEKNIGDEPTISYVGIRGDENREGYISKKENIQTIFPFRKNIWSEDVIKKFLSNENLESNLEIFKKITNDGKILEFASLPLSFKFSQLQKVTALIDLNVKIFNKAVFEFLKTTDYPVGKLDEFPVIENEDVIKIDDVFAILENSGVGIPAYYKPVNYTVEINGEKQTGTYARSRSGCFFCFYQQKIEWVWLLEQHPDLFEMAMSYEKEGYTWMEETLTDLKKPERVATIKKDHYLKTVKQLNKSKNNWQDEILNAEGEGCASCFI